MPMGFPTRRRGTGRPSIATPGFPVGSQMGTGNPEYALENVHFILQFDVRRKAVLPLSLLDDRDFSGIYADRRT